MHPRRPGRGHVRHRGGGVRPYAHFDATVRLRRADEVAKEPYAVVPALDHWLPTLHRLYRLYRRAR